LQPLVKDGNLIIGDVIEPVRVGTDPSLVPNILFYDNPRQSATLREMLVDFQLGEHLLLIGNQGVGKNKLAGKLVRIFIDIFASHSHEHIVETCIF
jgi:hypothetical protein